jgi:hypothetical protein
MINISSWKNVNFSSKSDEINWINDHDFTKGSVILAILSKLFWLVQSYNQIKNLTCISPCYQFNESDCWRLSFFRVENFNPMDIRTQQLIGYHQFDLQSIFFWIFINSIW